MLIKTTIKSGKMQEDLQFLNDGEYIMRVIPVKNKTQADYRSEYFVNIEEFCMSTGNDKYWVHREFKVAENIDSITKISLEDWPAIIETLKFFLIDKS